MKSWEIWRKVLKNVIRILEGEVKKNSEEEILREIIWKFYRIKDVNFLIKIVLFL